MNEWYYDKSLEQCILSIMISSNEALVDILGELTVNDFYLDLNKEIFTLIKELHDSGKIVDLEMILSFVSQRNMRNITTEYIREIINSYISDTKIDAYINRLKEITQRREIAKLSEETLEYVKSGTYTNEDMLDKIEQKLTNINLQMFDNNVIQIGSLVEEVAQNLSNPKITAAVKTGYSDLDNLTLGGFHNSDLIILAARPGMGKTALALNIALNMGLNDKNVLLFTLEMANDQLIERLISMKTGIPTEKMRSHNFTSDELTLIGSVACELLGKPIYLADVNNVTIGDIKKIARKQKRDGKLDILIIDYLQLIGADSNKVREQQVSEISRSLKLLAKELKIPVLALAQLSRGVETRTDSRPMLADIRESGSIEQDADLVIFLYRDSYYNKGYTLPFDVTEVLIKKHRHGQQGEVHLLFKPERQKFEDISIDDERAYTEFKSKK